MVFLPKKHKQEISQKGGTASCHGLSRQALNAILRKAGRTEGNGGRPTEESPRKIGTQQ